jgi:hypothetical protein
VDGGVASVEQTDESHYRVAKVREVHGRGETREWDA